MAKKFQKPELFVTQSQWAEGMEMIKDFFGKIFHEMQETKQNLETFQQETKENFGQLNDRIENVEKEIKVNTDSLGDLTKELREVKHIEFTVYGHEEHIKKLEKAR
jgi:chromosome segregation ATPase